MASFSATKTYIQTTESTKIDQPKVQDTKKQARNDYFLVFSSYRLQQKGVRNDF